MKKVLLFVILIALLLPVFSVSASHRSKNRDYSRHNSDRYDYDRDYSRRHSSNCYHSCGSYSYYVPTYQTTYVPSYQVYYEPVYELSYTPVYHHSYHNYSYPRTTYSYGGSYSYYSY